MEMRRLLFRANEQTHGQSARNALGWGSLSHNESGVAVGIIRLSVAPQHLIIFPSPGFQYLSLYTSHGDTRSLLGLVRVVEPSAKLDVGQRPITWSVRDFDFGRPGALDVRGWATASTTPHVQQWRWKIVGGPI